MNRPDSFDEDLMTDWSLWVLDHGLPELPDGVDLRPSVPVARWAGPRFGAVLHLQWNWGDDHDDDDLASEIELFRRTADGWEAGSGGSDWPFRPPLTCPALPTPYFGGGGGSGPDSG